MADVAFSDESSDCAGGDGFAADGLRRVDADAEAELAAKGFEAVDACFRLIAEAEVLAFVQLRDVQHFLQYIGGEGAGRSA